MYKSYEMSYHMSMKKEIARNGGRRMEEMTVFKKWCIENGYTAKSIAEKIGISIQSVYSYMEGRRSPNRATAKKLEKVYEVNSRDIFPL